MGKITMNWKNKYHYLIKEIAEKPLGEFPAVYVIDEKGILAKCEVIEGLGSFNFRLPDNSGEQDYKNFCEYLCERTNQNINDYFSTKFTNFKKKEE